MAGVQIGEVQVFADAGGVEIVFTGEVDIAMVDAIDAITTALDGARVVTIDLSGVTFIDGGGLDVLVRIADAAVALGAMVRYGTSRHVRRYLDLTERALPVASTP